jgi:hypothetical protein
VIVEVLAKCLVWTPSRTSGNRLGELELIFTRHLMHWRVSPSGPDFTLLSRRAHLFGSGRAMSRGRYEA